MPDPQQESETEILLQNPVWVLASSASGALLDLVRNSSPASLFNWISCTLALLLLECSLRSLLKILHKSAMKTRTHVDDLLLGLFSLVLIPAHYRFDAQSLTSFGLAGTTAMVLDRQSFLGLAPETQAGLLFTAKIMLALRVVMSASFKMDAALLLTAESLSVSGFEERGLVYFAKFARCVLWGLAFTMLCGSLGLDTSSLFAGFSVGGITLGFALQGALQDVVAAITIFVDRPFQVGDWISLRDGEAGQVKWIGLRATKLRIRDIGQTITVPNSVVVSSIVTNYTVHEDECQLFRKADKQYLLRGSSFVGEEGLQPRGIERFSEMELRLRLDNDPEALDRVQGLLQGAVEASSEDGAQFESCAMMEISEAGLLFSLKYTVLETDSDEYKRVRHEIGIRILKTLKAEGLQLVAHVQAMRVMTPE